MATHPERHRLDPPRWRKGQETTRTWEIGRVGGQWSSRQGQSETLRWSLSQVRWGKRRGGLGNTHKHKEGRFRITSSPAAQTHMVFDRQWSKHQKTAKIKAHSLFFPYLEFFLLALLVDRAPAKVNSATVVAGRRGDQTNQGHHLGGRISRPRLRRSYLITATLQGCERSCGTPRHLNCRFWTWCDGWACVRWEEK